MGSIVLGFLKGLSEIYLPGRSSYCVNPMVLIVLILIVSTLLYLMDILMIFITYVISIFSLLVIRGYRIMFKSFLYTIFFLTPYIVSAILLQLFTKLFDPIIILISCLRIQILIYFSIITVSLIDTTSIIKLLSKLSPNLGFLTAMTLKTIYVSSLCGVYISEIYGVNLKKLNRVKRLLLITRAITNLSLYSMFYIIEAFHTRRHIVLGRRFNKRDKSRA